MTTASYLRYFIYKLSFFKSLNNELTKTDGNLEVVGLDLTGETVDKQIIIDFARVIVFWRKVKGGQGLKTDGGEPGMASLKWRLGGSLSEMRKQTAETSGGKHLGQREQQVQKPRDGVYFVSYGENKKVGQWKERVRKKDQMEAGTCFCKWMANVAPGRHSMGEEMPWESLRRAVIWPDL